MIIFYEHMNAAWTLFAPLEQKTEEVENLVPIWTIIWTISSLVGR